MTDEEALVHAAQAGDRRATDDLLRSVSPRIAALCRRMTGNDADGDDATQEALLAVMRGLDRFDGRSAFGTWAYRVATNACLDELRRRGRRPVPTDDLALESIGPVTVGPERAGDKVDVEAALARLPLEFRAAVVLRDLAGFDYAEIGDILGIPPGTVRSRIARGRAALVPLLAPGNQHTSPDRPNA